MAWKEYSGDEHGYRELVKKHHPDAKVGRGHAEGVTQHTVGAQDHVVAHYDSHHKTGKVKVYEGTIVKKFSEFVTEARKKVDPRVKAYHEAAAKAESASKDANDATAKGDHSAAAAYHYRAEGFHSVAADKAAGGVDHQKRMAHTRTAAEHKRKSEFHAAEHKKKA